MGRLVSLYNLCVILSVCVVPVALNYTTVGYDAVYGSDNETEASSSEESSPESEGGVDLTNLTSVLRMATYCETPNHEPGHCVGIKQCTILLKQLNNSEAREFLRESRCGPDNENTLNPKVCCGTYGNYVKLRTGIGLSESLSTNVNILPESCGRQPIAIRGRLYGAKLASLGEYPWMARLIHKNKYGYKSYGCSGFLIHVKFVVTAAHCTHTNQYGNRGPVHSVVLGEHNTETIIDCSPGGTICAEKRQISRAANVMTHPEYDHENKGHYNDIALIQLKKAAKLSDFVQPICLPVRGTSPPPSYFLSGWGKTENESSSTIKMKVEIIKFDKTECKEKYSFLNIKIKETQICAGGEKNKDACTGDSGGPLMMPSGNGTYYASGIVSFGIGCGMKGWPGIYTNVLKFLPWIKSQMALSMQLTTRSGVKKKGKKGSKGKKSKVHTN